MAGILVYIPRANQHDALQQLVRVGLKPLLDPSVTPIALETRQGPDGGQGVLVTFDAPGLPATPREVDLATQEWRPAPPDGTLPKDRYWLGVVKDARPSAGELQRATIFDGEMVLLKDGNHWAIPDANYLPKKLTVAPDTGDEIEVVSDDHREFAEWSTAILDWFTSSGFLLMCERDRVIRIPKGLTYAALALAKNYRVTRDVVDLLGLIEGYEAVQVARVACGMKELERKLAEKKNWESQYQSAAAR